MTKSWCVAVFHRCLYEQDIDTVCIMFIFQRSIRTAANLTSTLLAHYIAVKLETILDKEGKITHEQFAGQIEARLGSGEGEDAKGPDMKVWSKGRGLNDVSIRGNVSGRIVLTRATLGRLGCHRILLLAHHTVEIEQIWI
jgi:hypothetical protein